MTDAVKSPWTVATDAASGEYADEMTKMEAHDQPVAAQNINSTKSVVYHRVPSSSPRRAKMLRKGNMAMVGSHATRLRRYIAIVPNLD